MAQGPVKVPWVGTVLGRVSRKGPREAGGSWAGRRIGEVFLRRFDRAPGRGGQEDAGFGLGEGGAQVGPDERL